MIRRILSIVKKDVTQISRNRFIAVITFLSIFVYAAIFHLMPARVDESYNMGFFIETGHERIERELTGEEGLRITWAGSIDELKKLVEDEEVQAGIAFTVSEGTPKITLFTSSQTPEEIREAGEVLAREAALNILGDPLNAEFDQVVIGPDLLGRQIPLRDRLRILFVVFVLIVEVYALGNLVSDETRKKTAEAILVTPVSVREFLAAKATTGVLMVSIEGILIALLVNIVSARTILPLLVFLLLSAFLIVGISFIVGALSRDFLSLTGYGIVAMIILIIPGLTLIFPATYSPVINAIPTYYVVRSLDSIVNFGSSLSNHLADVAYLSLFDIVFLLAGYRVLRRRLV
jgi:ABC-2 type transport system permease protein